MTAAVHGPRVTQADKEAAYDFDLHWYADLDYNQCEALAERFARHRDASQAELLEALEDIATQARNRITDGDQMGARCWRIGLVDILAEAERLTKARTDATGDGV